MFKTFLENVLYLIYLIFITYLSFNKFSTSYTIDLIPTIFSSLIPSLQNLVNFIEFYSNNIFFKNIYFNYFDNIQTYINSHTLYLSLTIITFGTIVINVLNSLYFYTKIFTLYNFLINLY